MNEIQNELFMLSVLWFSICNVYMCVRAQEGHLADYGGVGGDKYQWWSAVAGSTTGKNLHCIPRCIQAIFTLAGNLTETFSLQRFYLQGNSKKAGKLPLSALLTQEEWSSVGERAYCKPGKPDSWPPICFPESAPKEHSSFLPQPWSCTTRSFPSGLVARWGRETEVSQRRRVVGTEQEMRQEWETAEGKKSNTEKKNILKKVSVKKQTFIKDGIT